MKTILVSLLLFATDVFGQTNYIEVRGEGIVRIVPDQIYLRIRLAEKEKYAIDLVTKEKRMLDALAKIGVETKDVVIKDTASNFRSPTFSTSGLVLSKEYIVCLYDVRSANRVIHALDKLKVSDVRVDHLDHKNLTDFKRESSAKAIIDARTKAETLSRAIDQSVGKALSIEEIVDAPREESEGANVVFKGEFSSSTEWLASSLAYDEIRIECTVLARFELH